MALIIRERDIERTCTEFLSLDGWRSLKTDPVSDKATIDAVRRMTLESPILRPVAGAVMVILEKCVRGKGFGEPGMSDSLFLRYGNARLEWRKKQGGELLNSDSRLAAAEVMWLEWKSAKGKPKPHQIHWRDCERVRGALVLVAGIDFPASIEGFINWYRFSGLQRNERLRLGA